jgi:hypothetical protein
MLQIAKRDFNIRVPTAKLARDRFETAKLGLTKLAQKIWIEGYLA